MKAFFGLLVALFGVGSATVHIDVRQLKCLVCQNSLEELDTVVSKLDPNKRVEIGSYRLDPKGNSQQKTVPLSQSEVHLSELIDAVCKQMDDYVRATWKSNGQLMILKLITPDGKMNPDMSRVDIIQDDDLNKSLKYYCEGIMEEYEESIIKHYKAGSDNIDIRICSEEAQLCDHTLPDSESPDSIYDEL